MIDHTIKVSLCMIVYNEREVLNRCLSSVRAVVDEIVVVDTGSDDGTIELAKSLGATVHSFTWTDDFAAARNYGLNQCKGEWILILDADEELLEQDAVLLRKSIETLTVDVILCSLRVINFYGTMPPQTSKSHMMTQYRLFRNDEKLRFINTIHEQLDITVLNPTAQAIRDLPIDLLHYGYLDEYVEKKNKGARNLKLLEKEAEQENYNPWIDYHIASEKYRVKDYEGTLASINIAIRRFVESGKKPPSLIYKLKYAMLMEAGSYETANKGIDLAIQLYPDYVDLHYYKGLLQLNTRNFTEAIATFQHCLQLNDTAVPYLVTAGTGSFLANYYLSHCYKELGQVELAEEAERKAQEGIRNNVEN